MVMKSQITPLAPPLETVVVDGVPVLRFCEKGNYTDSFGFEWNKYSRTYVDSTLGKDLSLSRLELNLGFPVEFLKGLNVLEVGCGAGRFTEHLVKHAKSVVAVDFSEAVYVNAALGAPNLTLMQCDLYDIPELSQPIDLVFCRGVLQHTPDPRRAMKRLFDYVRVGGLVIFDVYKKNPHDWRSFKYFWRPFVRKIFTVEEFDRFIRKHGVFLYRLHHGLLKFYNSNRFLTRLISATPLYMPMDWEKQYGNLKFEERVEIFRNELVDMLFAYYDQPQTPREVIENLASIGQKPYSYDTARNHFRYKKSERTAPLDFLITKNGVLEV